MLLFFAFQLCLFTLCSVSLLFKKKALLFLALGCVACWLFCGLKSTKVGTDSAAYFTIYERLSVVDFSTVFKIQNKDYGFYIFMWLISRTHINYLGFQLFIYLIIWSNVFFFIFFVSKNKSSATYIIFCLSISFFMTGLRQSFAISVILLAFALLQHAGKNHQILYYLAIPLMIISGFFHSSAFPIAALVLIINFVSRQSRVSLSLFSAIYFFVLLTIESLYAIGVEFIKTNFTPHDFKEIPSTSIMFFAIVFASFFLFYKKDFVKSVIDKISPRSIKGFFESDLKPVQEERALSLYKNDSSFCYEETNSVLVYLSCASAITMAFCVANSNFMRFGYYFEPFLGVCLANAIGTIKNKRTYVIISIGAFLILTAYFVISSFRSPFTRDILYYEIW